MSREYPHAGFQAWPEALVRRAPCGIAAVDGDAVVQLANPVFCACLGYAEDELRGRSLTRLFAADQAERMLALHRRFIAGADEPDADRGLLRRDGNAVPARVCSVRVPAPEGQTWRAIYLIGLAPRRRIAGMLRASRGLAQSVLDGLGTHVCVVDAKGRIVAVNRAWRDFAAANGGSAAAVHEGADYLAVCEAALHSGRADAAEAGEFLARLREVLDGRLLHFELEYPCHGPDSQRWFIARVSRVAGPGPAGVVIAHDDVTALKQAQASLRLQATTDELTGVANRRHTMQALHAEFERVRRNPDVHSAVLALDVDHFKAINDRHGHAAGDAALCHITRLIGAQTRTIDLLGRTGGEEFAILLPDTEAAEAVALAQRLVRAVGEQPLPWNGGPIAVTLSVGVAVISPTDGSAEAALARADAALYEAKRAGRNAVRQRLLDAGA